MQRQALTLARNLRPLARTVPAQARSMASEPGGGVPRAKYMRGIVEQHTSPFEIRQVDTLFANFGHKLKHETIDNIPDLAPAAIIAGLVIWYVNTVNERKEKEARF